MGAVDSLYGFAHALRHGQTLLARSEGTLGVPHIPRAGCAASASLPPRFVCLYAVPPQFVHPYSESQQKENENFKICIVAPSSRLQTTGLAIAHGVAVSMGRCMRENIDECLRALHLQF